MRTGTKAALALTAILSLAACKDDDEAQNNTANTEAEITLQESETPEQTEARHESEAEAKLEQTLSRLTVLDDVPLVRNGVEFTADIRGDCLDYSLEIRDNMSCEDFLTDLVQEHALTHSFFTATTNKLSTDPAFIDAGLTGYALPEQRHLREKQIQRRLDVSTPEAIAKRMAVHPDDTFYIVDSVSDLKAADAPLMEGPE